MQQPQTQAFFLPLRAHANLRIVISAKIAICGRVAEAAGEAEERPATFSHIFVGIASVRCWRNPKGFGAGESTIHKSVRAVVVTSRPRCKATT